MKKTGFLKIYKKLLVSYEFQSLSKVSTKLLIYLLLFNDSFRTNTFFKYHSELKEIMRFSKSTLWRVLDELKILKINYYSKNNQLNFDFNEFHKYWSKND